MRAPAGSRPVSPGPRPAGPGFLPLLLLCGWLACLGTGCDFFATKPFSSKPPDIRAFAAPLDGEDTLVFKVTESLKASETSANKEVLARRTVRFSRAPETLQPGAGWIAVSVRIHDFVSGNLISEGVLRIRSDESGISVRPADSSAGDADGTRYYPLKVAATASADSAAGDLLILPLTFALGTDWLQALGALEVFRRVEATDTLDYRGRLEETWRIAENIYDGDEVLASGSFWYGATGLLKGEQSWVFAGRAADGASTGEKILHRELVRL